MCNVGELINGPVGNLVGMGIKALVNGTPVELRRTENPQKPKGQESIEEFYDNIEAHLKGTLRVLQPALEINKILLGECKSAGRERPAPSSGTPMLYYTPQNSKKSQMSRCPERCCGFKKPLENCGNEKSISSITSYSCSDRSAAPCIFQKRSEIRKKEQSISSKTSYSYSDRSATLSTFQCKDPSSVANCSNKSNKSTPKICFSSTRIDTSSKSCSAYGNQGTSCCRAPKKSSSCKSMLNY